MKKALAAWNRFFFEPIFPAPLGLFRILLGIVIFDSLVGKCIDREFLYGEKGIVSPRTLNLLFSGLESTFNAYHLVPSGDPGLLIFFIALMSATVCLTLGIFTRTSSVLVFAGLLALSNRNPVAENSGDDLLRIYAFFLMFAPSGAAFSIDRWLGIGRGLVESTHSKITPWAFRILQLQLCYVYLDSVYLKLQGPSWRDGTAVYYALNYLEFKRFEFKWLSFYLWQIKLLTWGTLAIEAAMFSLVWIRKLRYWCLAAAFLLHWTLNLVFQFPIFQYVMMASLALYIPAEDILTCLDFIRKRFLTQF